MRTPLVFISLFCLYAPSFLLYHPYVHIYCVWVLILRLQPHTREVKVVEAEEEVPLVWMGEGRKSGNLGKAFIVARRGRDERRLRVLLSSNFGLWPYSGIRPSEFGLRFFASEIFVSHTCECTTKERVGAFT